MNLKKRYLPGALLICATILALTIANTPLEKFYNYIFNEINFIGHFNLHKIVNDFLMAIFFLVVGCEIKYEVLYGRLSTRKKATLPIIAACGGVAIPALIFLAFNQNTEFINGIGIAISTDIAFAIGIFMILKNKLNPNLKIFLLSLAVVDDLISIIVIGIVYSSNINMIGLFGALIIMSILVYMNKILNTKKAYPYLAIGVILWYFVYISNIHSTISGVLLALTIPSKKNEDKDCILDNLRKKLSPLCNFFILPLFAFSNTAIQLNFDINYLEVSPLMIGIIIGLVCGKPIGIMLFSFIAVKLNLADKPKNTSWRDLLQVAVLAGVGFTMSIFVAEIAFKDNQSIVQIAKLSILIAAFLSTSFTYMTTCLKPIENKVYGLDRLSFGVSKSKQDEFSRVK